MKRLLVLVALVSCGGPAVPARTPEQRAEASAAEDTFERKLRYLFWLN